MLHFMLRMRWALLLVALSGTVQAQGTEALPEYAKVDGIIGNLNSIGSDTLANLMALWTEDFKKFYPGVNVQVQAAGSSTAPPALTEGTSDLGPMSRRMKAEELAAFEEKHGYKPTPIAVAVDALGVFVHKDNPVKGMTLAEVDAVFSAGRRCGHATDVGNWGQLGLEGDWVRQTISLYGRNSASGTYGYFKKKALCKGDYKDTVKEQPGSSSVVTGVAGSLGGIGYSGIGYLTPDVRTVPLARKEGDDYVDATPENALDGSYPLSRFLYVYVNKAPNRELRPLVQEFLRMVLSKVGQETVRKDGYFPLPLAKLNEELAKIQ